MTPVRHLYVHIPFCHRICPYCSFYKHTPGNTDIPLFLKALLAEVRGLAEAHSLALETVYFGGGTPSMLSLTHVSGFLDEFRKVVDLGGVREWTFEANPRTFDLEKVKIWREAGVSRVSLGVQAWDEPTLKTLGRDHSPAEAEAAYGILREAAMPVVSLDLMFAIPGQSLDGWRANLERTMALGPDHISAYNLNYEEDTEFFQKLLSGEYQPDDETDAAFFESAFSLLEGGGYGQYEVSNYARAGFESIHNQSYWEGADYLGAGPGAVSTRAGRRWKNLADTGRWTVQTLAGQSTETEVEELTPRQLAEERLALLLRTRRGVPVSLFGSGIAARAEKLEENGLGALAGDRLVLTSRGRLVVDSVAVWLMEELGEE